MRCIDGTCQYDVQLQHLIRNSGGVRVNDDGIFMKIPSVTYTGSSAENSSCSHYSAVDCADYKLLLPEDAPGNYRDPLTWYHIGTLADFPKLIHTGINHAKTTLQDTINTGTPQEADAAQRSLDALNNLAPEVVCNVSQNPDFISTRDCSGSGDADDDGFCDAIDYCLNTYSGSNCDTDGDFVGDGARSRIGDCRLVDILLPNVIDDPYYLAQLRKMMCGACDKCQGVDDVAHPYDRDGDGLLDYRDSTHECDPDIDGDGVVNDEDCYPKNHLVRFDLDEDGKCDDGFVNRPDLWEDNPLVICSNQCFTNKHQHGDSEQDRIECAVKCRKDNCAPPVDAWTYLCPFGEETRRLDCRTAILPGGQCPQGYNTRLGTCAGVNDADPFCGHLKACKQVGTQCNDYDSDMCFKVYANDQKDYDGDGIGDKCDWTNVGKPELRKMGLNVVVDPQQGLNIQQPGEVYTVSFRAWGGSVFVYDTSSGPVLDFEADRRTNTQIGACYCDQRNPDGSWHTDCNLIGNCPMNLENTTSPSGLVPIWKPIQAPQCSSLDFTGNPSAETLYNDIGYCHNRLLPFSRDEASNYYQFNWRWNATPDPLDITQAIGWQYDKNQGPNSDRTTKVRVAWPILGQPTELNSDELNEAAWSNHRALHVTPYFDLDLSVDLAPVPAGRVRAYFAEVASGWLIDNPPVARSGYLLAEDIDGSRVGLLAIRQGTPEVDRALTATFSEPMSMSAELTGASGPLSAAVVGGTGEMANGIMIYQGPSSAAKLFIGLEEPGGSCVGVLRAGLGAARGGGRGGPRDRRRPGAGSAAVIRRSETTLKRICSKIPARLLGKATVVLGAIMILVCPACEKEKTFEDEFASAFRACGLLSSGRTTNFWWTDDVRLECEYRCFMKWGCASLLPRACGTEVPSFVMDCFIDCIPEPVDCGDGTTVPGDKVCDWSTDCENGADESGCYPQFYCANGSEVIPAIMVCNDVDHCSDGSDEADCSPSDYFQCADGSGRVSLSRVCNTWLDCDDGSDESGCAEYICD